MEIEMHLRRLRIDIPTSIEFDTCECIATALQSGHGWAITTPLCAYQGRLKSDQLRFHPLPGPNFTRQLTLIARARELGRVPRQIASLAREALREVLVPFTQEMRSTVEVRFLE
jgi:DNA-binding transcriptional LysR family regulator